MITYLTTSVTAIIYPYANQTMHNMLVVINVQFETYAPFLAEILK